MLETIKVPLASKSYSILIGSDNLSSLGEELSAVDFPLQIAVISNPTVANLYIDPVLDSLKRSGYSPLLFTISDGEQYKTPESLSAIYDFLLENGFDRGSGLIALGGGVVGDIAGFAAATFLRGIPYVQVPTTLLAQVDSSVGGKTAINHPLGKNLIGAFYQPELVLIDTAVLTTLEPREVSAGLAEVVKYGVIHDYDFFCWLENNVQRLRDRDAQAFIYAIKKSCQIKSEIVAVDEREGSVRAHLNFGHTFGHAIEKLAGYGSWKHGEAVAAGMVVAAKVAAQYGLCSEPEINRLILLLRALDLPTETPDFPLNAYVEAMLRDKKVNRGTLTYVLNRELGDVSLKKITNIKAVISAIL